MAQGIKANISSEELEKVLKEHTQKEAAKIFNVSEATIKRYKNKYGLSVNLDIAKQRNSEKHTIYKCDTHYFDKIDTFNKAYLLGFMCADGFVTDRNEVGIEVAEKDKKVVEFFQHELKSNKPIKNIERTNAVELRLQNNELAESLKRLGIVPRKSLILNIDEVINRAHLSEEQISVFLLGYFDGDGCISIAHRQSDNKEYFEMNVTGTLETITYFKNYFGHGTIYKRHQERENNNYTLQFSNNYLTIYNALNKIYCYKDKLTFFFQRKYNLFVQLQNKVKS